MGHTPGWVRGGVLSRAGAFLIDYLLVMLIAQGVAALLYAPTGGVVQDSSAFSRECGAATARPTTLSVPPGFEPTAEMVCTYSFLSWPAARSYVFVRQQPGSAITRSAAYTIDGTDNPGFALDLAIFHWPLLALMRWAFERSGGRSPGRRLAKLRLIRQRSELGVVDVRRSLARRYLVFTAPAVPAVIFAVTMVTVSSIGFSPAFDLTALLGTLAGLFPNVALVAAAIAILRRRDAFYDEVAGTSVVRPFDAEHDTAPQVLVEAALPEVRIEPFKKPGLSIPWAAGGLCLTLSVFFLAEILTNQGTSAPSHVSWLTVMLWGGVSYEAAIQAGQWYRLISASFLHWSAAHLGANLVGLIAVGALLEPVVGASWFVAVFLLGGLSGTVASVAYNDPELLSAGASGGVMALFAAGLVISFRLCDGWRRISLQAFCLVSLATMLWPAAGLPIGMADHALHLGAAMAGGILGLVYIVPYWAQRRIVLGQFALGIAIAISAATFASVPLTGFGDFSLDRLQIPAAEVPKTDAEWVARASELVRRFPRDPRSQTARAVAAGDDAVVREAALEAVRRNVKAAPPTVAGAVYQNALMVIARERTATHDFATAKTLLTRAMSADLPARSELLALRADAERGLGQFEDAKADYERFLETSPNNFAGLIALAHALSDLGDQNAAIDRTDQALAIDQKNFFAWRQRGWFLFLDGRFQDAVSDLERANELNPADHYAAIWLHLASMRAGKGERLSSTARALDMTLWPGPAIRYLRREIDADSFRSAAADRDRVKNQSQGCEVHFYIAENYLLREDLTEASRHFLLARASCPKRFYEWGGASVELKRIER